MKNLYTKVYLFDIALFERIIMYFFMLSYIYATVPTFES